jgi:glycosyltransferase involved in cell wall biosynthesis
VVVDQNSDDKLEKIVLENKDRISKIKYYKVDFKGLSRARNFGMKKISEDVDVVAFPDDDCIYPENLLLKVKEKFEKFNDLDFITGISMIL